MQTPSATEKDTINNWQLINNYWTTAQTQVAMRQKKYKRSQSHKPNSDMN